MARLFNAKAERLVSEFEKLVGEGGTEVDVHAYFCALTLDIIVATAFDAEVDTVSNPDGAFADNVKAVLESSSFKVGVVMASWLMPW